MCLYCKISFRSSEVSSSTLESWPAATIFLMDARNLSPNAELNCHRQTSIISRNGWGFKISGSRQEIYVLLGGWVGAGEGRDRWEMVDEWSSKTNETNSRKNASSNLKDNIVSHRKTLGVMDCWALFFCPVLMVSSPGIQGLTLLAQTSRGSRYLPAQRSAVVPGPRKGWLSGVCLCACALRVWKSKVRFRDKSIREEITQEELEKKVKCNVKKAQRWTTFFFF